MNQDFFLKSALDLAKKSLAEGGIPIGSVLVYQNQIIGRGHNQRIQKKNPILHGEMDALANAGRQAAEIYRHSTLYTTLSPCAMCSGAILLYQIPEVVIGENLNFMGEENYLKSKGVKLSVMQDKECITLMQNFITQNPMLWHEDIGENA